MKSGKSLKAKKVKVRIESLAGMHALAEEFVSKLEPNKGGATLVGLSGDLGSGKTAFTQGVARALGVKGNITSPTFVIQKIYRIPKNTWRSHLQVKKLVH